jgi:hypothetical protein
MTKYIPRLLSYKIEEAHKYFPVIVVTGPRQSGKTSLCRHIFQDYKYVNLEDITTRAAAASDPTAFLDALGKQAIIDEVQNVPEILSIVQVRVDDDRSRRYILTGSSNFSLMQTVTQSLAGRAALFTLLPFSQRELPSEELAITTDELLWRGLYPGVIANKIPSFLFYQNYYNTYVERDLRNLLKVKNILTFDSFMRLLAVRVGSDFNASNIARELGVTSVTVSEWMSMLTTSYIAYPLRPYFSNASKRLTKMPKIYFYDTGLLCYLLGIENADMLQSHPMRGAVFENYAMAELMKRQFNQAYDANIYYYRENSGREVDAVVIASSGTELYEIKSGKTMHIEFADNMKVVADKIPNVTSSSVIFDGDTIASIAINVREI